MKMKYLLGLLLVLITGNVMALPHDNRSDVKDTVKVFIPWNQFSITADGTSIYSLGSGSPRVANINSLGVAAIDISRPTEAVRAFWAIPDNMCVNCPTKVSVLWSTASNSTSASATWRALYSAKAVGEALAAPATALDTTITADSILGTAYMLNETAQGVINADVFSRYDTVDITVDLQTESGFDASSSATQIHGIYIEYTRELL